MSNMLMCNGDSAVSLQVAVLVSVSEFAARPADHMFLLQIHSILNALGNRFGQYAGVSYDNARESAFFRHKIRLEDKCSFCLKECKKFKIFIQFILANDKIQLRPGPSSSERFKV